MGIFKQKMNFDQFSYFAIQQVYLTYEPEKEAIIDKAQWENESRLTQDERDSLWDDFTYFIPIGLGTYAIGYFKGKYSTSDIFARVAEAYVHFLHQDKGLDNAQVEEFTDLMMDYIEKFEEISTSKEAAAGASVNEIIINAGIAFTEIYSNDDRTHKQIMDQISTKSSDKMFTALKLGKSYVIKGGILDKLYKGFNITW